MLQDGSLDGVFDCLARYDFFCMIYLSNLQLLLCGYSFFCNCNVWNSLLETRPSECSLMIDNELKANSCTCTCMLEKGK